MCHRSRRLLEYQDAVQIFVGGAASSPQEAKPGDSKGSEGLSLKMHSARVLGAWVGPQLSGGSRTLMVLGQSCEHSRAPNTVEKPSPSSRGCASQNEARGGEKQQRAVGKNARVKYSRDGKCRQNLLEKNIQG